MEIYFLVWFRRKNVNEQGVNATLYHTGHEEVSSHCRSSIIFMLFLKYSCIHVMGDGTFFVCVCSGKKIFQVAL